VTIKPPKGKRPYAGTAVPIERTKGQITELLRSYGAVGVQWTDRFDTGEVQLQFAVTREDGGAIQFRITPAAFKEKHSTWNSLKGKHETVEAPDWPRSMRLLLAWLKTKLESIAFGLTAVEEEFLAHTVIRDAAGRETTVGELILPAIEEGGGRLMLEPARRKADDAVDANARLVG